MELEVPPLRASLVPPLRASQVSPLPASRIGSQILDEARTLPGALELLVRTFPDHLALTFLDGRGREERVTFAMLWRRARELARLFRSSGLEPGRVVLFALPTSLELTAGYFGAMLAGGRPALVATPFHRFAGRPAYAGMIGAILRVADAGILYAVEEAADICRAEPGVPIGRTRVLTPESARDTATGSDPAPADEMFPTPEPDDVAMVQYSSGSTGAAKGVLLTHRAMLENMRATRTALATTPSDVNVNWTPLYHDMGLVDAFLLPMLAGCPTILIPTAEFLRNPSLWLWAIHRYRATISWAPNFAYALCAKRLPDADIAGLDLSSWRVAANASEPCTAESMRAFAERFRAYGYRPEAMTPSWGLAETVCIATAQPVDEPPRIEVVDRAALVGDGIARPLDAAGIAHPPDSGDPVRPISSSSVTPSRDRASIECVSIGRCLPGCTIEIRGPGGEVLGERRVGSIWLRSPSLLAGYQGEPEQSRRAVVDGWLDTGDRGYLAEGHVFFVAREKDLIVIGGEKYAPQVVETAIGEVPGARQGCAIAFGIASEERGTEEVAAVIETTLEGDGPLAALRDRVRREVTRKTGLALRWVVLVPPGGIHKTTSGKLARSATRERYRAAIEAGDLGAG